MAKQKQTKTQELKKPTATQRIEGLEASFMTTVQNINILASEIDKVKQTIMELARRVDAIIKAAETGSITNDSVNEVLINQRIDQMKGNVDFLVKQEVMDTAKDSTVKERSFVVGRQLNKDKEEINPRMQFSFDSLQEAFKEKILNKKVGDVFEWGEGLFMEITEVYDIAKEVKKKFDEPEEPEDVENKDEAIENTQESE